MERCLVPPARRRPLRGRFAEPRRAVEQFAAAIVATLVERVCAGRAEGAFERADERARRIGRKFGGTAFAAGAHLEHQAATLRTASQIRSTTRST